MLLEHVVDHREQCGISLDTVAVGQTDVKVEQRTDRRSVVKCVLASAGGDHRTSVGLGHSRGLDGEPS